MPDITRNCRISGESFIITEKDQDFLNKMGVPLPTLCPKERARRRMSNRNERFLYHTTCGLTGKPIITSSNPNMPYVMYSIDAWWSDDWDPMDYGQDIDWDRPFFEQFLELKKKVPRLALQQQKPMENSDYCNCASRNKNCYLVFSTNHCEDCYYGSWINFCEDCVDNTTCLEGELCYDTVDCRKCYDVVHADECINCSNSAFIKNCIGCTDCLFCTNLQNKQYCIYNKQYTKEEYEAFKKELDLGSYANYQAAIKKFEEMKAEMVLKEYTGTQNENTEGNYIFNCRNCTDLYDSFDCEDVSHSSNLEVNVKDCMDFSYWGSDANRVYESQACGYDLFNLRFCNLCWSGCAELTYCDHMFSSQDCFGCVGLKKKKFCILNKQYTEEEYHETVKKLIEHMKKTGEWGEFFPAELNAFSYNESVANEWYPLSKDEALQRGYSWMDDKIPSGKTPPEIPDHIDQVTDDILNQVLVCEATGLDYKIIPQELRFYRKMRLPIPRFEPNTRHMKRFKRRNLRQLYDRACDNCEQPIKTVHSEDKPERVYCEACYLKEIF